MAHIIVYDFETVGETQNQAKDGWSAIPVSLAAKAFHGETFEPFDNGEFYTLIMPDVDLNNIHDACLSFLKMSRDDFKNAPPQKQAWREFQEFVNNFNKEKNKWTAPIAAGQNILNFDNKIAMRLNYLHLKKTGTQSNLFSDFYSYDLIPIMYTWFSHIIRTDVLPNLKLETILQFFKIPYEPSKLHNAAYDVAKTGEAMMKLLKWQRKLYLAHQEHFGIL